MASYYLSNNNLHELVLRLLAASALIAPVEFNGRGVIEEITAENAGKINLHGYRTVENIKPFIFRITEKAAAYFDGEIEPKRQNLVVLGMRACDLSALEVTDRIFLEGDYVDPAYQANRQRLTIITADCTDAGETCFCTLVKGKPYAEHGFDLNLAIIENGYLVQTGSSKGEKLITDNKALFVAENVTRNTLNEVENKRAAVMAKLHKINASFPITKELSLIHKINLENQAWRRLTKDCVECSACNFACPSCTCFLLLDASGRRFKVWDACLKNGYARVAGGANSRPKLYERLQNRYHCKFDYSFDRLGRYTCVGCGRCIDGCAGSIDMRKIFVELEKQAPLTAKLE